MNLRPVRASRPTVLVVDDHPANIQVLYDVFAADYTVLMSTSGPQALDVCRTQHPDLVLLDVAMPLMDGYAVLRELKADPSIDHIPVIFVTSHNQPGEEAHGLELGAVDFIAKPINPAVVRSRVKTHISLMQSSALMQAALSDKETLLKEVYHRVKNNLHVLSSLFNLQLRSLTDTQARAALTESVERVAAMALVHEKLYQSANLSSLALDDYVCDLCRNLRLSASVATRNITVQTEIAAITVGMEIAVPLGLLINELVTNSLKHAFPDERPGLIRVCIQRDSDGHCVLQVSDDGVGQGTTALTPSPAKSLGLKLIKALAGQIDGEVETIHGQGTCTRVKFALPQALAVGATPTAVHSCT